MAENQNDETLNLIGFELYNYGYGTDGSFTIESKNDDGTYTLNYHSSGVESQKYQVTEQELYDDYINSNYYLYDPDYGDMTSYTEKVAEDPYEFTEEDLILAMKKREEEMALEGIHYEKSRVQSESNTNAVNSMVSQPIEAPPSEDGTDPLYKYSAPAEELKDVDFTPHAQDPTDDLFNKTPTVGNAVVFNDDPNYCFKHPGSIAYDSEGNEVYVYYNELEDKYMVARKEDYGYREGYSIESYSREQLVANFRESEEKNTLINEDLYTSERRAADQTAAKTELEGLIKEQASDRDKLLGPSIREQELTLEEEYNLCVQAKEDLIAKREQLVNDTNIDPAVKARLLESMDKEIAEYEKIDEAWGNYGTASSKVEDVCKEKGTLVLYDSKDRKKEVKVIEGLSGELYYSIGGRTYSEEEFVKLYGSEYYQKTALYNVDGDNANYIYAKQWLNGDANYYDNSNEITLSTEDLASYRQIRNGNTRMFVDKNGQLHQIEYRDGKIFDSTDSHDKAKQIDEATFEEISKDWETYNASDFFNVSFTTSAGLFFSAELLYVKVAEEFGTYSALFNSHSNGTHKVINFIEAPGNEIITSYAMETGIRIGDLLDSTGMEVPQDYFDTLKEDLKSLNDSLDEGHNKIEIVKHNLMSVDSEFSESFRKEYNFFLKHFIDNLNFSAEGKAKQYYSNSMLHLVNDAINSGLYVGADMDVLRAIKRNTDFDLNASDWDKFWTGAGVFGLSVLEGVLSPLEQVVDGIIIGAALIGNAAGANCTEWLEFAGEDFLEGLYQDATSSMSYNAANGWCHSVGSITGEILGDIIAWGVIPSSGLASIFNGLKLVGDTSASIINSDDFDFSNEAMAALTGKYLLNLASGTFQKGAAKKFQGLLADNMLGDWIKSPYGWHRTLAVLGVHVGQGAENALVKTGILAINNMIDGENFSDEDRQDIITAFITGFTAYNKKSDSFVLDKLYGDTVIKAEYKSLWYYLSSGEDIKPDSRNAKDAISDFMKLFGTVANLDELEDAEALDEINKFLKNWKKYGGFNFGKS